MGSLVNYPSDFSLIKDIFNNLSEKEQDFISHEAIFNPMDNILYYKVTENAFIEVSDEYAFDVAVSSQNRREGIASSLILEAYNKFGYLKTWCNPKNKASIGLLHKLGFILKDIDDDGWLFYEKS